MTYILLFLFIALFFACKKRDSYKRALIFLIFIAVFWGFFSTAMNIPLSHDEHVYVTAGKLFSSQRLYTDFSYPQMPYLPITYAAIFQSTNTSFYLLTARIMSFFSIALLILIFYAFGKSFSGSRFVTICFVIIFACNKIILQTAGYAWNNVIPVIFALVSFYFATSKLPDKNRTARSFFSGLFIAIAIGFKLLYISLIPAFLIFSLIPDGYVTVKQRITKKTIPLLLGLLIGSLPILYYLITDPGCTLLNNIGYHKINTLWKQQHGVTDGMTFKSQIQHMIRMLSEPSNLIIAIVFFFSGVTALLKKMNEKVKGDRYPTQELTLSILVLLFTSLVILKIKPLLPQYFISVIPFIIIFCMAVYTRIDTNTRPAFKVLCFTIAIFSIIYGSPRLYRYNNKIFSTAEWTGISVHKVAQEIKDNIPRLTKKDKIATLSPLYAIESDTAIYEELAAGPFLYRVGDLLPEKKRTVCKITSESTINDLFEAEPPKAILVGLENEIERPLIEYAKEHKYNRVNKAFGNVVLYVK